MTTTRVIAHIDMDCFYCQVESVRDETLRGIPMAVVQYNPYDCKKVLATDNRKNIGLGSIIAVNYEARARGVKRIMKGQEARKVCPEIVLVTVPTYENKANLTIYRDAGALVVKLIQKTVSIVEKASIDEVYLDITELSKNRLSTIEKETSGSIQEFVNYVRQRAPSRISGADRNEVEKSKKELREGYKNENFDNNDFTDFSFLIDDYSEEDKLLAVGAIIVNEIREQIKSQLGYTCSAGIAPNKLLAKICSSMHKPSIQTIMFRSNIEHIMKTMSIARVPGWGGNMGADLIEKFNNDKLTFGDLVKEDRNQMINEFGEDLYNKIINASKGIDTEPVKDRSLTQQIGCSKNFRNKNLIIGGRASLEDGNTVHEYLLDLCKELVERVDTDTEMHSRAPRQFIISFTVVSSDKKTSPVPWKDGISLSKTGVYPQLKIAGLTIEQALAQTSLKLITKSVNENENRFPTLWGITLLGLQATNFQPIASDEQKSMFSKFLSSPPKKEKSLNDENSSTTATTATTATTTAAIVVAAAETTTMPTTETKTKKENHKVNDDTNDDIDLDVFNALPADIQKEILDERKNKRQKLNDHTINKVVTSSLSSSSSSVSNSKPLTISDKMKLKEKQKQKRQGIGNYFK